MNNKFDELTKQMAQSVTRRGALKKFGVGLAGVALACFGLANRAQAAKQCVTVADCPGGVGICANGHCVSPCDSCVGVCKATGGSQKYCLQYCKEAGAC
jgi:hypothetical protein